MDVLRCAIVELRQYTLHPGKREALVTLFDREFVESQEELGMMVLGQFRDLEDPDRFVWLRGFTTMSRRAEALSNFYSGPVWKANRVAANATMIDSDNVLLLRPAYATSGFPASGITRPPAGHTKSPASVILTTIYYRDHPFDEEFLKFFDGLARPALAEAGAPPLACLQTEYAENTFPALPVRAGVHAFVWFARFSSAARARAHESRLLRSDSWQEKALPVLAQMVTGMTERLRLAPTARSLLR
jgi:hypothetical protein